MKKSLLLAIGIMMYVITINGQDHKFSIGIVGSPESYSYNIKPITVNDNQINFSVGIRLQYNFSEKVSLQYGMLYSIKPYYYNFTWIAPDNTIMSDPSLPKHSDLTTSYVSYPLLVSYTFIKKNKLSLYSSAGIVTDHLLKVRSMHTILNDGTENTYDGINTYFRSKLNTLLISPMIDLGVSYDLNPKVSITIEPYLKYCLSRVDNDESKSKPVSYGATIGINYNFIN